MATSAFGGYLAGRLRAKWIGPRTDEVLFRDTAHGLLAWALATLLVAALFTVGTLGTSAAVAVTEGAPSVADAAQAAVTVTEAARKAAANFSLVTAISLLIGAFSARRPEALVARTATLTRLSILNRPTVRTKQIFRDLDFEAALRTVPTPRLQLKRFG
jgi:hypothetical protein